MSSGAIDRLSVWAVRYALGRMTYAVWDVVDVLVANREALSQQSARNICRDIKDAIESGRAGMEMDVEQWRRLFVELAPIAVGAEPAGESATNPGPVLTAYAEDYRRIVDRDTSR